MWRALLILLLWESFVSNSFGQTSAGAPPNLLTQNISGLRINNVTLSSSYFSESAPGGSGSDSSSLGLSSASATMLDASASFAWSKTGEKSTWSASYSPSYFRQLQPSSSHSFNQSLGVSATRKLSSKLTLAASFQGLMSDFNQLLFASSLYGSLAATPATFDELVSGLVTGQSSNPGLSQVLGLTPVNGSAQTAFLYGGRIFSASAGVSLFYAQSTRSSFHASLEAMRTQFLNTGSSGSTVGPAVLVPATSGASANVGWSYALSTRTTASVDVSSSRALSKFADAYATGITASIGHTLSTRWFVDAFFGAGFVTPVHQTSYSASGSEPVFGASVAYKFNDQTLLGSYTRTASDSYGLGSYATQSGTGAWAWNPRGSSISLSGGFGYSHLTGPASPASIQTTSWTAQASVRKRLQSHLSMSASYSYVQYPEALISSASYLALSGATVGLSWSPSVRQ